MNRYYESNVKKEENKKQNQDKPLTKEGKPFALFFYL